MDTISPKCDVIVDVKDGGLPYASARDPAVDPEFSLRHKNK